MLDTPAECRQGVGESLETLGRWGSKGRPSG